MVPWDIVKVRIKFVDDVTRLNGEHAEKVQCARLPMYLPNMENERVSYELPTLADRSKTHEELVEKLSTLVRTRTGYVCKSNEKGYLMK